MRITRREFGAVGCGTALFLVVPGSAIAASSGGEPVTVPVSTIDPVSLVNPELLPAIRPFIAAMAKDPGQVRGLAYYRDSPAPANWTFDPSPAVVERMIAGLPRQPDVRVFVVGAAPGKTKPAMLHIHGGGFVSGHAGGAAPNMQEVVTQFGCVAITVDYWLAPETPFPGSLNDNCAALLWLHRNAPELGVDRDRIILAGESAGAGHAAMLAIAARDRGEVPLRAQILTYPMLDDRTGSSRPVPPYIGAFIWQPEDNRFGWSSLLGQPAGSETVPSGSVPARVTDLRELPATFIGVGSINLFAEEGVEYARQLVDAIVSTELHLAPGAVHGFDSFAPRAEVSTVFRAARDGAIRRAFSA